MRVVCKEDGGVALMLVLFLVGGVVFSLFSLLSSLFSLLPQGEWKNARRGKVD